MAYVSKGYKHQAFAGCTFGGCDFPGLAFFIQVAMEKTLPARQMAVNPYMKNLNPAELTM